MFESLFGAGWPLPVQFFVAFVIVLILIGATFWLIRRFGTTQLGTTAARGRQPRLAVIDAAAVDARRRLVLIRRDNVEHLVMIGGPSDVVIEQNIVRAVPVAPQREVPGRAPGEALPREPAGRPAEDWTPPEPAPRAEFTRPQPEFTPRPLPEPPRPELRPQPELAMRPEPRPQLEPASRAPEPPPRILRPEPPVRPPRAPEPVLSRAPEPVLPRGPEAAMTRVSETRPPEPIVPRAAAVDPRVPVPPDAPVARPMTEAMSSSSPSISSPPPIVPAAEPASEERTPDVNLANMAQRLEAALRRPFTPPPNESISDEPRFAAPEPRAPLRFEPVDDEPESEPEAPRPAGEATRPAAEAPRPAAEAPRPAPPRNDPARQKSVLDSLEEEMASLLGRPPGKE